VHSTFAEASLPSIVRGLTLGDLPTSLWWTEDVSEAPPLAALVSMARQLVYDSRQWRDVRGGVLALKPLLTGRHEPGFVDLNWRRLAPMREAILHAVGSPEFASSMLAGARIRHRPGDEALAWLLGGGCRPSSSPSQTPDHPGGRSAGCRR
jgi:glucose-6-phosphate dehydrogenase assembly protein OpcA